MPRRWFLSIILITAFLLTPFLTVHSAQSFPANSDIQEAIATAVLQSVDNHPDVIAFSVFEMQVNQILISDDGKQAVIWLASADRQTGEILASEPGLAIAELAGWDPTAASDWKVTLQVDEIWNETLQSMPENLISPNIRDTYMSKAGMIEPMTFSGYKLPWASGNSKRLTQSIGHVYLYGNCSSCLYGFDFADGTMFPILASRGGTVHKAAWTCPNNNHSCVNYLILKDQSTSPTSYQIYYHLAYDSIPPELRTTGASVLQGQYIGNTDNTGASTGHHLHFQVTTSLYNNWGQSVDITFDDVDINGGRPRQCVEVSDIPPSKTGWYPDCHSGGDWFTSSNAGTNPPSGDLGMPAHGSVINTSSLAVGGLGWDDRSITRMQVIANWDGTWNPIGEPQTENPFITNIDLCTTGIPNGPVDLALRVWDYEGNQSVGYPGLRGIYNNAGCMNTIPTECQPNSNQAAIFSEPGYQGTCKLLDLGTYTSGSLAPVGDNNTDSVLVGSRVRAVLYDGSLGGRPDGLEWNDANLADNRIGGVNRVSSIIVETRDTAPGSITFDDIFSPNASLTPSSNDSLVLSWWRGSAIEYSASLTGPVNQQRDWGNLNNWSVGSLPAGNYTLSIQARNGGGMSQGSKTFTISPATLPDSGQQTIPYSTNFDSDNSTWTATGFWRNYETTRNGLPTKVFGYNDGTGYYNSYKDSNNYLYEYLRGDLTSPPIQLPAGSTWLRFDSLMDSESNYPYWDRRIVQISVNGSRFTDLYEMQADPPDYWTSSPALNLSEFAGNVIRIRFHFDAVEYRYNTGQGWLIDNFSVTTTPPDGTGCAESSNDSILAATATAYGQTISDAICPAGDLDYYYFDGEAGDTIGINVDAQSNGSSLDPVLHFYDSNGRLLEMVDDEVYTVIRDPLLNYVLPSDGRYYFGIQAWDHPGGGGENWYYQVQLIKGANRPTLTLTVPNSQGWIPPGIFQAQADVTSFGSNISQVAFFWHSADWENGDWVLLGVDSDGSNGWTATVNPSGLGSMSGSAIFARATDLAGNQGGDMRIIQQVDTTPPAVNLQPPANPHPGTAVQLLWTAHDEQSGMDYSNLDVQDNSGGWQVLENDIPPSRTSAWHLGTFGHTFDYRLTGFDRNGNSASSQVRTKIETTCTPDPYELDPNEDLPIGAIFLPLLTYQEHNLCGLSDADWVRIIAPEAKTLVVRADSLSGGAAVRLKLFDSTGSQLLAEIESSGLGKGAALIYPLSTSGEYLLRVTPLDSRLAGTNVRYKLFAFIGLAYYLPIISR